MESESTSTITNAPDGKYTFIPERINFVNEGQTVVSLDRDGNLTLGLINRFKIDAGFIRGSDSVR